MLVSNTNDNRKQKKTEDGYNTYQKTDENLIIAVIKLLVGGASTAFEMFLRKDFGERYFNIPKFILGLIMIISVVGVASNRGYVTPDIIDTIQNQFEDPTYSEGVEDYDYIGGDDYTAPTEELSPEEKKAEKAHNLGEYDLPNVSQIFFVLYLIAYVILGLRELRKQFERRLFNVKWHSFSLGVGRFGFLEKAATKAGLRPALQNHILAHHVVQLYLEPLFLLIIGFLLVLTPVSLVLSPVVGAWFMLGAVSVFARTHLAYHRIKKQVLDVTDTQIENEYMADAMEGSKPEETQGLTAMALRPTQTAVAPPKTSQAFKEAFKKHPHVSDEK
jgi:hypothetical protein